MPFILAALAGFILGATSIAWYLTRRYQQQVQAASETLSAIAAQQKAEKAQALALKQQVADLQYRLNRAENDLRATQN